MSKRSQCLHWTLAGTAILAAAGLGALAGCSGDRAPPTETTAAPSAAGASAEMAWARAALERNPALEVLALDAATGVFTVRDRGSGEIRAVRLAELAAAPVEMLAAPAGEPATAAAVSAKAAPAGAGAVATEPPAGAEPELSYTLERSAGQVRVSGPGVSIVSATGPATEAAPVETGPRTVDPIICDGERVMQINSRSVVVSGDAVTARNGCQLHITNSRITATGVGIVVRDATVHITNSTVEGGAASFDAGRGARVFLQGATLSGVTRRDEGAEVHEQGNNRWH